MLRVLRQGPFLSCTSCICCHVSSKPGGAPPSRIGKISPNLSASASFHFSQTVKIPSCLTFGQMIPASSLRADLSFPPSHKPCVTNTGQRPHKSAGFQRPPDQPAHFYLILRQMTDTSCGLLLLAFQAHLHMSVLTSYVPLKRETLTHRTPSESKNNPGSLSFQ